MAICTSLVYVDKIDDVTDIIRVTIDDEINAYMIYNYNECLKFLGQEVVVSYRKDIYHGKIENFINTLTIPTRVTTLDREDHIKLFCDVDDNNATVCFRDVQLGETVVNAIMFCVESKYESSQKAVWMTLKVRDKVGRIAHVRLFDYSIENLKYDGVYVKASIKRTKYGFTTTEITPMILDFPLNPEIAIARSYIEKYFVEDEFMQGVLSKTSLLDHMERHISLERGYELVRLAVQLDLLQALRNEINDIDFTSLAHALVFRHGYIAKGNLTQYSPEMRTVAFALQNGVTNTVMMLLDTGVSDTPMKERGIYKHIINLADEIIKAKKEEL